MEYKKQTRHNNYIYVIHRRGEDNPNGSDSINKQTFEKYFIF
jgi:hypothetical protein